MYKCQYCDRELKSKAGQLRHENSCEAKDIVDIAEEISSEVDSIMNNAVIKVGTINELYPENTIIEKSNSMPKEVTLEVLGGAETYYDGHPRRLTKLKGMLSATFDRAERHKIQQLILKVENENAYER